ncbi:hypothetical protein ACJRO7_022304 [Eucalyptus globulus]|uniref:Uncharacterized protein n=1 Tax=Eucalyptus globulus TaxID=34317 RepID=A0ABD3KMU1_EUCGL
MKPTTKKPRQHIRSTLAPFVDSVPRVFPLLATIEATASSVSLSLLLTLLLYYCLHLARNSNEGSSRSRNSQRPTYAGLSSLPLPPTIFSAYFGQQTNHQNPWLTNECNASHD